MAKYYYVHFSHNTTLDRDGDSVKLTTIKVRPKMTETGYTPDIQFHNQMDGFVAKSITGNTIIVSNVQLIEINHTLRDTDDEEGEADA